MLKVHNKNTGTTSMDVNSLNFMIILDQNLIKIYPVNKYMLKFNNRNTRKKCEL